jgi:hypothetical protein
MEHACPGSIRNMAMTTTVGSRYKIVKFSERWRTVRIVVKNSTFTVREKQIRTCLIRLARSSRAVAPRRVHWSCMHLHAAGHRSDVKDSCHWFIQFFAPVQSLWKTAHHSREHWNDEQKTQTIETRNRNFERADHCALRAAHKKRTPRIRGAFASSALQANSAACRTQPVTKAKPYWLRIGPRRSNRLVRCEAGRPQLLPLDCTLPPDITPCA